MLGYIVKRLLIVIGSLLALITLSFALVSLIPGDPARATAGEFATAREVAQVRHRLGLDEPLPARYADYVSRTLRGDLGRSFFTNTSVGHDILVRLPNTLVILVPGLLAALLAGLALGSLGAYLRHRLPDRVVGGYITAAQAIPEFVVGLLLIYFFFYALRVAPAPIGMVSASAVAPRPITGSTSLDAVLTGSWSTVGDIAGHAILPIVTLGIFLSTYFAKTVRTGFSQALGSQQIEFARACGLPERRIFGYALVSVRSSLLTYIVILFGASLGGAAIIETVFSWPGVGAWSLEGVIKGDLPVIQGFVLVMGVSTLLMYVALDVVVMLLDPRIRRG
jgi:peptide/nickel transport system permease protein